MNKNYSFIYPYIAIVPEGYDLNLFYRENFFSNLLVCEEATINIILEVFGEGKCLKKITYELFFRKNYIKKIIPISIVIRSSDFINAGIIYCQISIKEMTNQPVFNTKIPPGHYALLTKPGSKTVLTDNSLKYGDPSFINLIENTGKIADVYPVVHLDRKINLAESLLLINPFPLPILVTVSSHRGLSKIRIKVPPLCGRWVRLIELLEKNEISWFGPIQITATNRIILFMAKHNLSNPTLISDIEHLDTFRFEETHMHLFRKARIQISRILREIF